MNESTVGSGIGADDDRDAVGKWVPTDHVAMKAWRSWGVGI
ncbi:hypothetical protein RMSM_01386 [Rhodopirellula maiorica SM1]|uniref:Uncharacterized protein n=1 Tax=Rhodopirellula maiorica SM1 TaxID=1265738 RepID=M5S669_9BACT|nr:hypothetical protein RMSM_01386 [Rhodopirellula maiorica SM1]